MKAVYPSNTVPNKPAMQAMDALVDASDEEGFEEEKKEASPKVARNLNKSLSESSSEEMEPPAEERIIRRR